MSINNFISTGWNSNGWKELKASFYREESKSKFKITSKSGRLCCLAAIPLHLVEFLGVKSIVYGGAAGVCALKSVVQLGKAASGLCCRKEDAGLHLNKSKKQIIKAGGYVTSAIAAPFGQIARTVKAVAGVFHPGAYFKPLNQPFIESYYLESTNTLYCDRRQITKEPENALRLVALHIPLFIQFLNEEGFDANGLTREFYTLVFSSLSKKLNLHLGQKGIIQYSSKNDQLLQDIGRIFAHLFEKHFEELYKLIGYRPTYTGEVFHLDYFKGICAILNAPSFGNDFDQMEDDTLLKILEAITPPPEESEALIKFYEFYNENKDKKIEEIDPSELKKLAKYIGSLSHIKYYNIPDLPPQLLEILERVDLQKLDDTSDLDDIFDPEKNELDLQGYTQDSLENDLNRLFNNLEPLHKAITGERDEELDFAKPQLTVESRNRLKALHTIAKSMSSHLNDRTLNILKTLTPQELSERIQGKFTREDFIALIQKADVEDKYKNVLTSITLWMEERTDEELKAFLQAITGSTSLPSEIEIEIDDICGYIKTNTCTYTLNLNPTIAQDPKKLYDALNYLISENAKSFQDL